MSSHFRPQYKQPAFDPLTSKAIASASLCAANLPEINKDHCGDHNDDEWNITVERDKWRRHRLHSSSTCALPYWPNLPFLFVTLAVDICERCGMKRGATWVRDMSAWEVHSKTQFQIFAVDICETWRMSPMSASNIGVDVFQQDSPSNCVHFVANPPSCSGISL